MTREAALKAWETMHKREAEMSDEELMALKVWRRAVRRKAECTRRWRKLMTVRVRALKKQEAQE